MQASPEQIGIYGGTFHPVHHGHLMMARDAMEELQLDRVLLLPNQRSPLRQGEFLLPGAQRLELLELALKGEAGLEACDLELQRPGLSYLVDTLGELQEQHPDAELTFLMGADSLESFSRWHDPVGIARQARIAVFPRPGSERGPALARLLRELPELEGRIVLLEKSRQVDLSSSEIRERLQQGLSVRYMIPDAMLEKVSEYFPS